MDNGYVRMLANYLPVGGDSDDSPLPIIPQPDQKQ